MSIDDVREHGHPGAGGSTQEVAVQPNGAEAASPGSGSSPAGTESPPVPDAADTDPVDSTFEVSNCTNDHLHVSDGVAVLQLSPLASVTLNAQEVGRFALRQLQALRMVRLVPSREATGTDATGAVAGLGFWALILFFAARSAIDDPTRRNWFTALAPICVVLVGLVAFAVFKRRLAYVAQGVTLLVVIVLGAGAPVAAFLAFGDGADLIRSGGSNELFGRLTQTLLIIVAAVLPTMLYFIFDRQRVRTLRHSFHQQILRLDPTVSTLYDVEAKYGDLLAESVGGDVIQRARINRTNPYPIFLAGVLVVLGWLLVFPVVDDASTLASPDTVTGYLVPRRITYVYGFLGAYFFTVMLIARRYVRGDLRPKAYGTIAVRIVTVMVLAWMLDVLFGPSDWTSLAAFLVGVVPETFFTLVAEGRRAVLGRISEGLREPHPLTNLEGIDLYDRARLLDEGVNNVEALAHHDLVELMLATRIPVPRLVDWVDQAILYLHTADLGGGSITRNYLRVCGIRTASDLIVAHADPDLWKIVLDGDTGSPTGRLRVVQASVGDDEWMANVLAWRNQPAPSTRVFEVSGGVLAAST